MFKKKIEPLRDNIYLMYLIKHIYLIAVNEALIEISPAKNYKDVKIPLSMIDKIAATELSRHNIDKKLIGVNMASLSQEDLFYNPPR